MPLFSSLRAATANHSAARRLAPRWKLIDAARASNNAEEGSSALEKNQLALRALDTGDYTRTRPAAQANHRSPWISEKF
jgi:hypothetical protein